MMRRIKIEMMNDKGNNENKNIGYDDEEMSMYVKFENSVNLIDKLI